MLKSLFSTQKKYIDFFFDHLEMEEVEEVLQLFLSCRGIIFFTGIGKSGIIAQKITATLVSTGIKAMFIPPVDALHGDLGMVSKADLLVILSKSGQSDELLELVPHASKKGVKIVSILSNKQSPLCRLSNLVVHLPIQRELCPFDLAPTTSTAIQLIFGDVLAVALMKARSLSLEDYASNHPSGRIGKRAKLLVSDLMLKEEQLPICNSCDLLKEVIVELSSKKSGCLLIVDNSFRLEGIFTDGDLRRALQQYPNLLDKPIGELMIKDPRVTTPSILAFEAMQQMESKHFSPIMVLPVVEEQKLVGLLRLHDLIQAGL